MPDRSVLPAVLAAVCVAVAGVAGAQPSCPAPGAAVDVFVDNLSADPSVVVALAGELLDPTATCAGAGDVRYEGSFTCTGTGLVACGIIPGLRPGAWKNHLSATVTGSNPQRQHQRAVFVAGPGTSNVLVWTIYPQTFVVGDASETSLRAALDAAGARTAARPGPALVTFSGTDTPQTINLTGALCSNRHPAALCFTGSRVVVDALDATGRPGAVTLSVGTGLYSVLQLFGSDDVFRGLVFEGSTQKPPPRDQFDTVAFTAAGSVTARRNRIEQSIIRGPTRGDAVSGDTGAGPTAEDANVIDGCEVTGAQDKGAKITTGAHLTVRGSCIHDNLNGGVQSTLGGHVLAVENLIQHNVPGSSENGISVRGLSACLAGATTNCDDPSTGVTDGNIVRFHGGRGVTATDNAVASFANDYVADNQIIGSKVETTVQDPLTAAGDAVPMASLHGVALVCNGNAGVSGRCADGTPCLTDPNQCGIPGGCSCPAQLTCMPISLPSFGAAQSPYCQPPPSTVCKPAPQVDYGDSLEPGRNAFARNGTNFHLNVPGGSASAEGNQWEHCGPGATCDTVAVATKDILPPGAMVSLGTPAGPRADTPVLARVSPERPRKDELVRIFGDNFNAIDGTACAQAVRPVGDCSAENPWVEQQNQAPFGNSIRITTIDGQQPTSVWPDAVTPTMLAFRMPFDCFAPLTLEVAKSGPDGGLLAASTTLCDPGGCAGQPADHPCDDHNACTVGDHCDGNGACQPGEPAVCASRCLTGSCDPTSGCVPRPVDAPCDDGDVCTIGDHCSGHADVCLPGAPRACPGACLSGVCDPRAGCLPKPPDAACDDGDPCTVGDHCAGDRDVCVPGSAACDDGDPCTEGDVCSSGVCRGVPLRGFDFAICQVGKRFMAPSCAADPGDPGLERLAGGRLRKAEMLLGRAADTPQPALRNRLVRQSAGALHDITLLVARYRTNRKISRACAAALKQAVGERRRLVMGLVV